MSKAKLSIPCLILLLCAVSCNRSSRLPESLDSYHLTYQIKYLEENAGDIPTRILPRTMEGYYTRHHVRTEISGFLNQFSLVMIADLKQKEVTTLLTFFGTKVYYIGEAGMLPASIVELPGLEYNFTGNGKTIGGLSSEQVEINTGDEVYHIYFTRDIPVKKPNISTPYREIEHPLTDFRVQLSHLKMHLICESMEVETIESEILKIPEGYDRVNQAAMEEIINSLFTND